MEKGWDIRVLSAYDGLPDERYLPAARFKGFGGSKWRFFLAAIAAMREADLVFFGHINLAPLMRLCQVFFPRTRTICMAHGREVWEPLSQQQGKALKNCSRVWSVSQFTADILTGTKGVAAARVDLFYNTLDPAFSEKNLSSVSREHLLERYQVAENEKVIITVARLSDTEAFKGYDLVLEALPGLLLQFPNLRYLLCGKWQETEKKRITKIINELKLHNVVKLTGFVPDFELISHYQLADVFVLPSRKEGFGIVFLEAAWCGLRVIGGNQDGSVEALLDGRLGMLVNPTDPVQITAAIRQSLSSPLNQEQKDQQQQLVEAHFGFTTFKNRQSALIAEVVGASH